MEHWEVLDSEGNPLGRTVIRGKGVLADGEYHLVVHLWLLNSADQLLIHKRPDHLEIAPGFWATIGGSAIAGETSIEAVLRENKEEMGFDLNPDSLTTPVRMLRTWNQSITDMYVAYQDVPIELVKPDPNEVEQVRWAGVDEVKAMLADGSFFRYKDAYFDVLAEHIDLR